MRIKSGVKNGGARGPPTFYSDQVSMQFKHLNSTAQKAEVFNSL